MGDHSALEHDALEQPADVSTATVSTATSSAVSEPFDSALSAKSSANRLWAAYRADESGEKLWWVCDNDWFLEDQPGSWTKYRDPKNEEAYWWNNDTSEYFFIPKV